MAIKCPVIILIIIVIVVASSFARPSIFALRKYYVITRTEITNYRAKQIQLLEYFNKILCTNVPN